MVVPLRNTTGKPPGNPAEGPAGGPLDSSTQTQKAGETPALRERPCLARLGPVWITLLMAVALVPLARLGFSRNGPFLYVLSGGLFLSGFNRAHIGGALDQPSITKWYVIFTFFSVLALPYIALLRVFSNRRTPAGYYAYLVAAAAVCVCLLIYLTVPFWWTVQYIAAMGITARRLYALAFGLGGYVAILLFICWAARPPHRRPPPER